VRLIIIDPITSYLGRVDSHKNAEIRSVLEPVAQMAARHGAAVVGITHFSKGGGTSAINRFIGSIGFIAAARAAFVVTTDPDSDDRARRLFIPVKNNLAPCGDGLSFRIEQCLLDNGILASRIEWGSDTVTRTADEGRAEPDPRRAHGGSAGGRCPATRLRECGCGPGCP
jgi:AAA domain